MSDSHDDHLTQALGTGSRIVANVKKVIVGKDYTVKLGVASLLSRGHILIEGVPGVGKTMFARSMARHPSGASFRRILPAHPSGASSAPPIFCPATSPGFTSSTRRPGSFTSGRVR